ncbi:hypothetical protein PUN28_018008 [Cardiocondyla obscurior]|uniref:Protein translocase subunit SecA n=1 Tax=Cardiocondyla obscurior TaxID=286306 RepID=A0AAW2EJA6_9HYME
MDKTIMKDLIKVHVKLKRYSLKQIKNIVEENFKENQLNIVDYVYIEKKYIKYCLYYWIEEIDIFLNTHRNELEISNDIVEGLLVLTNIKHFNEVSSPFNKSEYYTFLVNIFNCDLGTQHDEDALIRHFKEKSLELLLVYSDMAITQIEFLEALVEFLNMYEKDEQYTPSCMLKLQYLSQPDISNDDFFETILNVINDDVKLKRLKCAAKHLVGEKHIALMKKYKEIIGAYFKPVCINTMLIDNRKVVELIGGNFRLSKVENSINSYLLKDPDIKEVRFICSGIIYADVNLENSMWHGKNIVMYAKAIRVCNTITWDVSGNSAKSVTSCKAGTANNGNGIDGECGECGESGGNVLIHANNIFQSQKLHILTNGGNGSDGENGGDGKNGENGTGISFSDFTRKFPNCAKFSGRLTTTNFQTIVNNIKSLETINISWQNENCSISNFQYVIRSNAYIEAVTAEQHKIYFSCSFGGQSFVLYKGSLGKPGGRGGKAGVGGQGGYPGEVISNFDVVVTAITGINGKNGKAGKYGNHGQNGWDMGYIGWLLWRNPIYYGADQNRVLDLNYFYNSASERIYVPYRYYINSPYTYAQILTRPIPKPASVTYEENEEISMQAKRQVRTVRKKNISKNHIFEQYSQYMIEINVDLYQNLQARFKDIEQNALQKIMENDVQQINKILQINIMRIQSSLNGRTRNTMESPIYFTKIQESHEDSLENVASLREKSLNDWIKLKNMEIEYSDFNELFSLFKSQEKIYLAKKDKKSIVQNIKELLMKKWHLAVLQKISTMMENYQYTDNIIQPQITAEKSIKYLLKIENNLYVNLGLNNENLGNLQQYFFEDCNKQREKIYKFCTANNMDQYTDAFKYSIIAFVMDHESKTEEANSSIKEYYEAYSNFVRQQSVKLKKFLKQSKLKIDSSDKMITEWLNSLNNPDMQNKLKNDFKKTEQNLYQKVTKSSYKSLYEEFTKMFDVCFDWDNCYKNPKIRNIYAQHIRQEGPLSPSYRELLAHIYGVCIYVYTTNYNNEICLLDVHNSQCTEILYILYTNKKFVQLNFNQNYFQLDMRREIMSDFYLKIIKEVELLNRKDCDEYLEKKLFLSEKIDNVISDSTIAIDEEKDIYDIIQCFSDTEEKRTVQLLLGKISSKFIGEYGIIHAIARCFSCNGRHLTYYELYYFIHTILTFVVEDRPGLNIFRWIIMAYSQSQWLNEVILLKLENYFQKPLKEIHEWRKNLTNIKNKEAILLLNSQLDQSKKNRTISTECITEILYLLSSILEPVPGLECLKLSEWPYAMKEKYWETKLCALTKWEHEELQRATYYLLSLDNNAGTCRVNKFIDALIGKNAMSPLNNNESVLLMKKTHFLQILSHFYNGEWVFSKKVLDTLINCEISTWMTEIEKLFLDDEKDRNIDTLIELMDNFYEDDDIDGIDNPNEKINTKHDESLNEIKKIVTATNESETMSENVIMEKIKKLRTNISIYQGKDAKIQYIQKNITEIFNLINNAIQLKRNYRLRDTQKLAILTLLKNQKMLIQASTGEGKSLIVVVLAIFKTLCGQKVDIITSSSVLAKRDAQDNSDIYNLFSINVSHNCTSDVERLNVYSSNDVIYGDLANFQRDYLLDQFYDKNILGDHPFDNVVIDEVDSMLLDKGNNILYLSHELPNFDKLESVYVYIWQLINRPVASEEEFFEIFDSNVIKCAVMYDLFGRITKENISMLDSSINVQKVNAIWQCLRKNDIINNEGYLLQNNVSEENIKDALSFDFEHYQRLIYLFQSIAERERQIHIPNYLKPFVVLHLNSWINSAKTALFMQERTNYVVDVDRKENKPDRNAFITIIDQDTGTDQANSEWDEALHQFLQLKHGCKLSMQQLKAVFISNVSYLNQYDNLYGLTGTLGSSREQNLLQKIYNVKFVTIPTTKVKKFHECNPIVCSDLKKWSLEIYDKAISNAEKRSVLIICETVKDVESLYDVFKDKQTKNVHTYTRDYETFDIATEPLCVGQIIIATNLAGRGTDIKITDKLDKAGGLHVILSYLPINSRIEQQAFGRAARCGNNGSGRLIIKRSQDAYMSQILYLKQDRDFEEIRRISNIILHHETRIYMEEKALRDFKKEYTRLKNILTENKTPKEITDILLYSCLDEWAFWVDENSKYVNDSNLQNKQKYEESLNNLIKHFNQINIETTEDWQYWIREPNQLIKLAKNFALCKNQNVAIKLFDRIIEKEPYFSEAAHYYKAFSLIKNININDKHAVTLLKRELRQASKLLKKHRDHALMIGEIIDTLKHKNSGIIQINAFKEQHKNISTIYEIFLQSIYDILGHPVTPETLQKYDINKEELAETLFDDFLENNILKKPKISQNFKEKTREIKKISDQHHAISNELNIFIFSTFDRQSNDKFNMNLRQYEKRLKNCVIMPNREEFWNLLIKDRVLINEVKYVTIIMNKLKSMDPSLAKSIVNIKEQSCTLRCKKQELLLYPYDKEKNLDDITIEENVLKNFVSNDKKYKFLKQRGVFISNKKATFDSRKVDSVIFPRFDLITQKDFTERSIPVEEAKGILAKLVENKILAKQENDSYQLITDYDKIVDFQLSSYCVYESFVKQLLETCFKYRIALQKLIKDFTEAVDITNKIDTDTEFKVNNIQILSKPHQSVILSLIEEEIIKPVKVSNDIKRWKEKLYSMYNCNISQEKLMNVLYQNDLIPPIEDEILLDYIIKEKLIVILNTEPKLLKPIIYSHIYLQDLINTMNSNTEENKINVSLNEETINKIHLLNNSTYKGPTETIKTIIKNYTYLSKKNIKNIIVTNLEKLRNPLKILGNPDCSLKSLLEYVNENGSFTESDYPEEELQIFILNGLKHLLTIHEKRWTWNMILNTIGIVVLAIVQIIIGNLLMFYSAGTQAGLGSAFISEGIGDIMFALMTLRSGYFSWNSYKQHKLMSLAISAMTFGIGAYMSYGKKVTSIYASKVAPNILANGKKITEMTGKQLTKHIGRSAVTKDLTKHIILHTTKGVALGIANVTTETIVDNYLQTLCRDIELAVIANIDQVVNECDMHETLKKAYEMLGPQKAFTMIMDLSNNFFVEQDRTKSISLYKSVINCILQNIKQTKSTNKSIKVSLLLGVIGTSTEIIEKVAILHKLNNLTKNMLITLKQDIVELCELSQQPDTSHKIDDKDICKFEQKVIDMWKSSLHQQTNIVIKEALVKPMMSMVMQKILKYTSKNMQRGFKSLMEDRYFNKFEKYKKKYEKNIQDFKNTSTEMYTQTEKEYHKTLIGLLKKTKNPDLFANIVRENIPMDMSCVSACLPVIERLLIKYGNNIKGLTIIVENETGLSVRISSNPYEEQNTIISLNLENNHFQVSKDNISLDVAGRDALNNNCLHEALCQYIPELRNLKANEFREQIAKEIETNPQIREQVSHGWHKFSISAGLIGGAKNINNAINDKTANDKKFSVWKKNEQVDKDLTILGPLNNELLNQQCTNAFREALKCCNDYLNQVQGVDRDHVSVNPCMFQAIKYDTIFVKKPMGDVEIGYFPVEMKATVEVLASETKKKLQLVVEINVDNPLVSPVVSGPQNPYIGYKISGPKSAKYKTCGHVIMNKEGNEYLPHRRPDNIKVNLTENIIVKNKIPITSLFYGPTRPNLILERTDPDYDRSQIRGKSFVTIFY